MTSCKFSITQLCDVFPAKYIETLVRQVLDYRANAPRKVRTTLEKVISSHIQLDGCRIAGRASTKALLTPVYLACQEKPFLFTVVLHTWVELQPELQLVTENFIHKSGLTVEPSLDPECFFTAGWNVDEMLANAQMLMSNHPGFSDYDVALMLCWLSKRCPLLQGRITERLYMVAEQTNTFAEQTAPRKEITKLLWDEWLTQLQELSPDAVEWNTVDDFLGAVRRLAESKRYAREIDANNLKQALDSLTSDSSHAIDFFGGIQDVYQWDFGACPNNYTVAATERIVVFDQKLNEYWEISQLPSSNRLEMRERQERQKDLEEELVELYNSLANWLLATPRELSPLSQGVNSEDNTSDETEDGLSFDDENVEEQQYPDSELEKEQAITVADVPRDETSSVESGPVIEPYTATTTSSLPEPIDRTQQVGSATEDWCDFIWSLVAEDDIPALTGSHVPREACPVSRIGFLLLFKPHAGSNLIQIFSRATYWRSAKINNPTLRIRSKPF